MKTFSRALLAASITLAASTQAAPYSDIYAFGDSLTDSGTFGLRFTNAPVGETETGLVAIQHVANSLDLGPLDPANQGGNNYAVGGDQSDDVLDAINNDYLANVNRADSNAFYYINGGGNNILAILSGGPLSAVDEAGPDIAAGINALHAAGAQYIFVSTLPDVGTTPAATALDGGNIGPTSAFVSGLAATINTGIVDAIRNTSANVIVINTNEALNEIKADPGLYGFDASQGDALLTTCYDDCANENTTHGINSANPNPDALLFNDDVHPTIAAQKLLADYVLSIVNAPAEIGLLPQMAMNSTQAQVQRLQQQIQVNRYGKSLNQGQWEAFAITEVADGDHANASTSNADSEEVTVSLGGTLQLSEKAQTGVMISILDSELTLNSGSQYEMTGYALSAYFAYEEGNWFANSIASVALHDFDNLKRSMKMGATTRTETGDTDGLSLSLAAEAGFNLLSSEQWQAGPLIGMSYTESTVDGYSEGSNRSTALNVEEQRHESFIVEAGLFAKFTSADQGFSLGGELTMSSEQIEDQEHVTMSNRSLDVGNYYLPGYQQDSDEQLSATLLGSMQLSDTMKLSGSVRFEDGDDDNTVTNVGISWVY